MFEWLQENGQAFSEGNDHIFYDDWFNSVSSGNSEDSQGEK